MGSRSAILRLYGSDGARAGLYRALRLRCGRLERLVPRFPPAGVVVDLGCGDGLLCHLLLRAHPGLRVVAVDHDPARVGRLRASARGLPVEAVEGDFATFPLPECDAVALVDVLHYLDDVEQERLLDRVTAALRPRGVVVLRDPDAGAGWRFRLTRLHERAFVRLGWTRARLGRFRSGAAWAALLEARGLGVEVEPLPRATPYADRVVVGTRR